MLVPITALWAALLTIVLVALGFHVGAARSRAGISILHGDDMRLATAIRRHQNFLENVPIALLLMALIELNGGPSMLLNALGALLLLSRIAHPFGLHHEKMQNPLRAVGAGGSFLVIVVAAGVLLWQAISA